MALQLLHAPPASNFKNSQIPPIMKPILNIVLIAILALLPQTSTATNPSSDSVPTYTSTDTHTSEKIAENDKNTITITPMETSSPMNRNLYVKKNILPILALTIPFLTAIAIVWIILYYRRERERDKYHILEKAIEHDRQLPAAFYHSVQKPIVQKIQSGICWIGVGIAFIIFFICIDESVWSIGIIPVFIGLAQIAMFIVQTNIFRIFKSDNTASDNDKQD